VDDLVSRGVSEPYRMFTSRAEYRLMLREDNADLRLTEIGRKLGIIEDGRWESFCRKREAVEREQERLKSVSVNPRLLRRARSDRDLGRWAGGETTLADLLRRPEFTYDDVVSLPGAGPAVTDPAVAAQVEIQAKYHGYIERQKIEISRLQAHDSTRLPEDIDFGQVHGLSTEARQVLSRHRPKTVGEAARLAGVTPVAVSLLLVHLKRCTVTGDLIASEWKPAGSLVPHRNRVS